MGRFHDQPSLLLIKSLILAFRYYTRNHPGSVTKLTADDLNKGKSKTGA